MSRSLRALFFSLPLTLPLAFGVGAAQAQDFGYDEVERQQELLGVWYEIREGNAQRGDTRAMFDVGMANYVGRGTDVDYDAALHWFARAADDDHAGAHYYLGFMFAAGRGTAADEDKALEHYTRSAELGYANAQYWLGSHYARNEQSNGEALEWLGKAAEQGQVSAKYYYGFLHETGRGTNRNPGEAARWYTKAAERGDRNAQIGLGRLHQNGQGVERDLVEAYVWYSLAEDRERMEAVKTRMSQRDLDLAQSRLDEQSSAIQRASAR
ncbi:MULTISPECIES: tetratricopeptide repeat protein [unclassified Thioalkalivibrio]|uniref:tetratricopeptide repeat protein n=1 Tax=unclassified Thioalkalivibrio TaxID=2621013 RepID=UPI00036FFB34|nr:MULTISPECIES: tetratricopeptide repeat protein [unclassified Thioalkalivibrio]